MTAASWHSLPSRRPPKFQDGMCDMTTPICEARFDPINDKTVLIAPKRARRPKDHKEHECPGCIPKLTPPAVYVFPEDAPRDGVNWHVRVVPNKYSCFSDVGGNRRFELKAGLGGIQDPAGKCEVVFETKRHSYPVYARTTSEIEYCFRALISRYRAARSDARTRFWYAFKNLGKIAGGTLDHEHWQLYSLPFIPPSIHDRYGRAAQFYNQTGKSYHSQMLDNEKTVGDRVVAITNHFLTFVPFASGMPYEICIAPLRDSADFSTMTEEELIDFAESFHDAVVRLYIVHPELAFNVAIHTAAFEHASAPWYSWYLSILPRLTTLAGVELGINVMVNPVAPEEAASTLRALAIK